MKILVEKGAHVLFLSSNQVFNGKHPMEKPDAARKPINEYGRQKAEVEMFIETLPKACILRLTKVIYQDIPLLKNWLEKLSKGKFVFAFEDMTLSPVKLNEVVIKIDNLVNDNAVGIFQLSGKEDLNYFNFAQKFAEKQGYPVELIKKGSWKDKLHFTPPKYTSLINL